MKRIRCTALLAIAISLLLAGCDSDDPVFPTIQQPPPPPPMVWDQANWNDVLWHYGNSP